MTRYYSTFIAVLLDPVRAAFTTALPDAKVNVALDGLIAYASNAGSKAIQNLPFVRIAFTSSGALSLGRCLTFQLSRLMSFAIAIRSSDYPCRSDARVIQDRHLGG